MSLFEKIQCINRTPDLVGNDSIFVRPCFLSSWAVGSFTYTTNGAVLLRIRTPFPIAGQVQLINQGFPDVAALGPSFFDVVKGHPFRINRYFWQWMKNFHPCEYCDPLSAVDSGECPRCGGYGTVGRWKRGEEEFLCSRCEGSGFELRPVRQASCGICKGTGWSHDAILQIGDMFFACALLDILLANLDDLVFYPASLEDSILSWQNIPGLGFTFSGGCGRIMPMEER